MADVTKSKVFDFTDGTEWTLTDLEISSDVLTLPDPTTSVSWALQSWGYEPKPADIDADANYIPPANQAHEAMAGSIPFSEADSEFYFLVKRTADAENDDDFTQRLRLDTLTDAQIRTAIECRAAQNSLTGRYYNADGALMVDDQGAWATIFPKDEWRLVVIRTVGTTVAFNVYNEDGSSAKASFMSSLVDRENAGTFGLIQTGASLIWTLGGGADQGEYPNSRACPAFAVPSSGTARLTVAAAWTVPDGFVSFNRLLAGYNYTNDAGGDNLNDVTLYYNLYHSGAWSGWTAVAGDGDLSAVTAAAGDLVLVGADLSNASKYRTWPGLNDLTLGYTASEPDYEAEDSMREVLINLMTALDADATVSAYSGFHRTRIVWPRLMAALPNGKCGVFLKPINTPEVKLAHGKVAGVTTHVKQYRHRIEVYPWVRLDRDLEEEVLSERGLLEFTEDVKAVLRTNTLGGSIEVCHVEEAAPSAVEYGEGPNDALPAMMIAIEVWGDLFEGT